MRSAVVFGMLCATGGGLAVAALFANVHPTLISEAQNKKQSTTSRFDNVTDEQFCRMETKNAEKINRETPITIDWTTKLQGVVVVCALRIITYNKSVSVNISNMKPGWREAYQRGHDQTTCGSAFYAAMARRGWRIVQRVNFSDGKYATFETVACP